MTNFIFATGAKSPFNDKCLERRYHVVGDDNTGFKSALINLANLQKYVMAAADRESLNSAITVIKGTSMGRSTFINEIQCFDEISFFDDETAKKCMNLHSVTIPELKPFKIKAIDRRYTVVDVVIKKPKQPNFAIFQNDFKRRGR